MARIPIAVVGTGFGCRIQVPAFGASGRFDVIALVGRCGGHTEELARRLGVPRALTSLDEALALPEIAAVSIATPPDTHAAYAMAAAHAGKHVLCEKPMAVTLAEARAMLEAVHGAAVVGMIDHEFRFDPARVMLGRLIAAGALGTPRLVTCLAMSPLFVDPYRPAPAWWFDAARGGGWLGASGSHLIDALRVWLGDFAAVAALVDTCESERRTSDSDQPQPCDADDTFSLLFRLTCGAQGAMQQSAVAWGPRLTLVRVTGSDATAWIDERGSLRLAGRGREAAAVPIGAGLALPDVPVPHRGGPFARWEFPAFVRQAERFADAIEGRALAPGAPDAARFEDGVACQAVMDAAREAARTQQWVRLDPVAA